MNCEVCGKSPLKDGVVLHRQNEKGVEGRWRCSGCNDLPLDPEVVEIVNIIQGEKP